VVRGVKQDDQHEAEQAGGGGDPVVPRLDVFLYTSMHLPHHSSPNRLKSRSTCIAFDFTLPSRSPSSPCRTRLARKLRRR
jgi:hypothetical protein